MAETVHNNVQRCRTNASLTQADLASIVGVSRQTIVAIEKGNYIPSVLLALKIAETFKKPVENIFTVAEK